MLGANDTMDVIFATHWIYPSRSPVLQPVDRKCIDGALEQRTGEHQRRADVAGACKASVSY